MDKRFQTSSQWNLEGRDSSKTGATWASAQVSPVLEASASRTSNVVDWIDADAHLCLLQPEESFAFSFLCTSSSGALGKTVGYPVIKWCTSMGEFSIFKGDDIFSKGAAPTTVSNQMFPLKAQCIDCPSIVSVNDRFEISVRIRNTGSATVSAKLQCTNTSNPSSGSSGDMRDGVVVMPGSARGSAQQPVSGTSGNTTVAVIGLCVTGVTQFNLGSIDAGQHVDITLTVFALNAGLHDLEGMYLVDNATNVAYCCSTALQKVFVADEENGLLDE